MTTTDHHGPSALRQPALLQPYSNPAFARITRLATHALGVPIAAIMLEGPTCQRLVAWAGAVPPMIPRGDAPTYAGATVPQPLAIADLTSHPDYAAGLLAQAGIRFYAGAPLVLPDGTVLGAICAMDRTTRCATAEEMALLQDLASLVLHEIELRHTGGRIDPLSGLPNRHQFFEEMAILAAAETRAPRVLAVIDLARPDELSHMLHAIGAASLDGIVRHNATRLQHLFGPPFAVYHVATTQFALLAPPGTHPDAVAEGLADGMARGELGGSAFCPTTCTSGLALITPGEAPAEDLLRRAHAAVDDARTRRIAVGLFSPDRELAFRRSATLLTAFAAALHDTSGLRLVFQPRLDLASGRCLGVEALLRWTHPHLGEIAPVEFIKLVERTTMVRAMMRWVLRQGIAQLSAWRSGGLLLKLSLNVSPANLEEPDFAAAVLDAMHAAGLPPTAMELEVTENALLDELSPAMQQLRTLSAAGISIAIDDFGTGYSSLSYLERLPADVVKIDKSFICGLTPDGVDEGRRRTLVAAVIRLSHDLGYRVVAEGIETQAAADTLDQLGCDEVQGFLYARPMPPDVFVSWYGRRPWHPARRKAPPPIDLPLLTALAPGPAIAAPAQ